MQRYRKSLLLLVFSLFSLVWLLPARAAELPDFTGLVKENSPAVVNISTTQKVTAPRLPPGVELPDLPEGSPWGDLFRKFFGEGEEGGRDGGLESTSLGSGFIIDSDGYIVTNYHVVKDADEIIVRLRDRRELPARVIGSDERSDLALLKIAARDLPVVKLGHSSRLQVGEWVFAIGSPFGFDHSVSVGVVSAIGRSLPSETYIPFIQTDVAINPGNSGGPLFNMRGEVVGINSQIYSRTGGFMGLSFAIPVDTAMDVIGQIKAKGHVTRGWLGVLIQDVNRDLAESFGLDKPMGALVLKVLPNSPAAHAGFQVGDVIVEYAGKQIVYSSDLPVVVGQTRIDSRVRVKVIRRGKPVWLHVMIGKLPNNPVQALREPAKPRGQHDARLGLVLGELDAAGRKALDLDANGVVVREVKPGPAFDAGIRQGDVIVMLNNTPVRTVHQLRQLSKGLPSHRPVPVLVQRRSGPLFLALRLDGKSQ